MLTFFLTKAINIEQFKIDVDELLRLLNLNINDYYNKWVLDVSNFINPAPEKNFNYFCYLNQKQQCKLLIKFKIHFLKFIYNDVILPNEFITTNEIKKMLFQPQIVYLFNKYSIGFNYFNHKNY